MVYPRTPRTVTHPGANSARRRVTSSIDESVLTDRQSLSAVGLKDIRKDGEKRQQTSRYDDSDDVIERIAMN